MKTSLTVALAAAAMMLGVGVASAHDKDVKHHSVHHAHGVHHKHVASKPATKHVALKHTHKQHLAAKPTHKRHLAGKKTGKHVASKPVSKRVVSKKIMKQAG